jgi:phage baseplate assembly protein W
MKTRKLIDPKYLSFPFRVDRDGVLTSYRQAHIKEQIEQVLFTNPKERIFRPFFGAGVQHQVFEPNAANLWSLMRKRLLTTLAEALLGEVDPKTIDVDVKGKNGNLLISISYKLATINRIEQHQYEVTGGNDG